MRHAVVAAVVVVSLFTACSGGVETTTTVNEVEQLDVEIQTMRVQIAALEVANNALSDQLRDSDGLLIDAGTEIDELRQTLQDTLERLEITEADLAALERSVQQARACERVDTELPEGTTGQLVEWLTDTESSAGEVPADLQVVVETAAGNGQAWLFAADFSTRFEPAVFATTGAGEFVMVWSGVADSDIMIREEIIRVAPSVVEGLAECIDVSRFVDG